MNLPNSQYHYFACQRGVIPGLTWHHSSSRSGSLNNDLREQRAHIARVPARAQWNMQRMHPQVTHTPILPIERHLPLPIDRFVWIQVATVQKACLHLYNGPETLLTNELRHLLRSREEGKLRGTAH